MTLFTLKLHQFLILIKQQVTDISNLTTCNIISADIQLKKFILLQLMKPFTKSDDKHCMSKTFLSASSLSFSIDTVGWVLNVWFNDCILCLHWLCVNVVVCRIEPSKTVVDGALCSLYEVILVLEYMLRQTKESVRISTFQQGSRGYPQKSGIVVDIVGIACLGLPLINVFICTLYHSRFASYPDSCSY